MQAGDAGLASSILQGMANQLVRGAGQAIAARGGSAIKKHAKKAAKKHAKKAAKHEAKKTAAKKHAKKAAKHESGTGKSNKSIEASGDVAQELLKAFHHLQRASAVISLIEPESGGDLKVLLHHGIERYRAAAASNRPAKGHGRSALGLLRAAEHLAMAGLYAARGVHQLNIETPPADVLEEQSRSLGRRFSKVNPAEAYGQRLHAMAVELLKRAEAAEDDPHLAWELVMGADGICFALETGIE